MATKKINLIIFLLLGLCYTLDSLFTSFDPNVSLAFWNLIAVGAHSIRSGIEGKSRQKKINRQIKRMPKYTINPEAKDTQNIARSRAYGRDRAIQMAEESAESQGAQDIARASDITDSTSGLLNTIASINANTVGNKRDLAMAEAGIQRQNIGDLYQANQAMIDEKDKAWYQNVYAPWETKLRMMQQNDANRSNQAIAETGALAGGMGGFGGGGGGRSSGGGGWGGDIG